VIVDPGGGPPIASAQIQFHDPDGFNGEWPRVDGDDWRELLAWARARTNEVYIRFDPGGYLWAGAGAPPDDLPVLTERPVVPVDMWIEELLRLRRRIAELETHRSRSARPW
jgi:hypothetical protein